MSSEPDDQPTQGSSVVDRNNAPVPTATIDRTGQEFKDIMTGRAPASSGAVPPPGPLPSQPQPPSSLHDDVTDAYNRTFQYLHGLLPAAWIRQTPPQIAVGRHANPTLMESTSFHAALVKQKDGMGRVWKVVAQGVTRELALKEIVGLVEDRIMGQLNASEVVDDFGNDDDDDDYEAHKKDRGNGREFGGERREKRNFGQYREEDEEEMSGRHGKKRNGRNGRNMNNGGRAGEDGEDMEGGIMQSVEDDFEQGRPAMYGPLGRTVQSMMDSIPDKDDKKRDATGIPIAGDLSFPYDGGNTKTPQHAKKD